MAPLRGWAPRGVRLQAKLPYSHWNTMTFVAALRHDRIDAPWHLDGPINGQRSRAYVENVLTPTLNPGDMVIMDNLASHKGAAPFAMPFAKSAPGSSCCQNIHPISIRSNRYSPS